MPCCPAPSTALVVVPRRHSASGALSAGKTARNRPRAGDSAVMFFSSRDDHVIDYYWSSPAGTERCCGQSSRHAHSVLLRDVVLIRYSKILPTATVFRSLTIAARVRQRIWRADALHTHVVERRKTRRVANFARYAYAYRCTARRRASDEKRVRCSVTILLREY